MMSPTRLPRSVSLLRIVSQGLVGATAAADPLGAVHSLLAIQGQQVSAVPHAIIVRAPGADAASVRRAFDEGGLVRSWPMRGTVHVTAAEDHHWMRAALAHRYDSASRSAAERGLEPAAIERAGAIALGLIDEEGPVHRERLMTAWREEGLLDAPPPAPTGSPMSDSYNASWPRRRLLVALHVLGVIAQGPMGAGGHLIIDASRLPDETTGPAPGERVGRGLPGHRRAIIEIARRYALGHGPVNAADLARWTSLPAGECSEALEGALELGDEAGTPLARFRLDDRGRGLKEYRAPLNARERRASAFYMRSDANDLLLAHEKEARRTLFLGMFDELHVGYKDRSCLSDETGERLICPAANGMFRPILVDAGRLVAVRPSGRGILYLSENPSLALRTRAEREVLRVLRRLGEEGFPQNPQFV